MERDLTKKNLRKYNVTLICSGIGIIIMTTWLFIKFLTFLAFDRDDIFDSVLDNLSYKFSSHMAQHIFLYSMMAFDLILRAIVSFFSIRIGRYNKKVKLIFIIICVYFTLYELTYIGFEIHDTIINFNLSELFYCFLDAFFLYPLIYIDISLIKLRKTQKKNVDKFDEIKNETEIESEKEA